MKSNAPGQLLGYAIQFPRALIHLLRAYEGDSISIENLGDVAINFSNGNILTEEDKSSILKNPITDKSENLWKSLSNWIDAVNNNILDITKTSFLLFANRSGRSGLANKFHLAKTEEEAKKAIEHAKEKLKDLTEENSIWVYYNNVVNLNYEKLITLIKNFELEIHEDDLSELIRKEFRKMHVADTQIQFLEDGISGWLLREVINKINNGCPAIIKWEDFSKKFQNLFERARKRELFDFTRYISEDQKKQNIENEKKIHPLYVRQIERIEGEEDDIIEAISDYLKAKVNRDKWIETQTIDEEIAEDFELKLKAFWKNENQRISIINKSLTDSEKGKLLYSSCKDRKERIRDIDPPANTVSGTYHSLVDSDLIGWHPDWKNTQKNSNNGNTD